MKIVVDTQSVEGQKTGIGNSAKNLLEAISAEAPEIELVRFTTKSPHDLNTPKRIFWESVAVPLRSLREKPDWIFSPGFAPAFFSPTPQAVMVHDLIGMIYPQNLPPAARFYWAYWLPLCVKRARVIVASSESTRRDIVRLLKVDPAILRVVPLACGQNFFKWSDEGDVSRVREKYFLNQPYFLTVGTLEPRKNIPNLLRAFKIFKDSCKNDVLLALAGKSAGQQAMLELLVQELGLEKELRFLGYVSDEELNMLYNGALGYAFVSTYEGFGLPVLEAMNCGLSGILSNRSSLPEVAGDTALYVDPFSVNDIAEKLTLFYEDNLLRGRLSEAAKVRAKIFSWKKAAQSMIAIFKKDL